MIDLIADMIKKSRGDSPAWQQLITGVGDDCAVWRESGKPQLAKVDCQIEGVHFDLKLISWEDLGWRALAVNLSDIAAMGGLPRYALVSLGLPLDSEVEDVLSLYRGLLQLAEKSGTAVVGGNLAGSPHLFVDVNLIGETLHPQGEYLSRYRAQPGDLIAVTGWLGSSAAGRKILEQGRYQAQYAELKQAFARPEPRLAEGRLLLEAGVSTGLDISDGLLSDLGHICRESRVQARLYLEKLPVLAEVKELFGERAYELALSGGEDYQLLFTAQQSVMDKIKDRTGYPVTIIGEITQASKPSISVLDARGKLYRPYKTGWDHFKRQ